MSARYVAAVDLGSHTFALVVARTDGAHAGFRTVDVLKERVSLTQGLRGDGTMERATVDRALAVLERFGERLRAFDPSAVRVVGTSALRVASQGAYFREAAQHALGFPVQIIEGQTEARLVYVGVAHGGVPFGRRMVVDIGGGSTEIALGQKLRPDTCWSRPMGHLERAQALGSKWKRKRFEALQKKSIADISEHVAFDARPDEVVGTGGTIRAVASVLSERGGRNGNIARADLRELAREVAKRGREKAMDFDGLSERRRLTFAGGVITLRAVVEALEIECMVVSPRGLREGILHELLDHPIDDDLRERTVLRVERRYGVDVAQGARVARTAEWLAERAGPTSTQARLLLTFGARLHELGQALQHRRYHKSGARIIRRSALPGFAPASKLALAALVRLHRPNKNIRKKHLARIPDPGLRSDIERCVLLLRIATILRRDRGDEVPAIEVSRDGACVVLQAPRAWLDERPLTVAALDAEARLWRGRATSLRLEYVAADDVADDDLSGASATREQNDTPEQEGNR